MTVTDFIVRLARLPEEAPTLVSFVHGLQLHEHAFEPNRRTDDTVAQEYFDGLMKRIAEHDGRVFVAERNGELIGWLVALVETLGLDVLPDERSVGYIVELFVASAARRIGVASALARAAEAAFRARGLKIAMIGVLPGNHGAKIAYEGWGYSPYAIQLRKRL